MSVRPDNDIKHHIEAELRCCPDVDETDIAVKVTNGTATLTGYVHNIFHKYGAEDVVKRVAGVVAIANDIQVPEPQSAAVSDPELARAAVRAIRRQLPLHWEQIRPIVHHGSVTLEGIVDESYQREEVVRAVRRVRGVVSVVDVIALVPDVRTSSAKRDSTTLRLGEHDPPQSAALAPSAPLSGYRYQSTHPYPIPVSAPRLRISRPAVFQRRGTGCGVSSVTLMSKGLRSARRPGELCCVAFICLSSLKALSNGHDQIAIRANAHEPGLF